MNRAVVVVIAAAVVKANNTNGRVLHGEPPPVGATKILDPERSTKPPYSAKRMHLCMCTAPSDKDRYLTYKYRYFTLLTLYIRAGGDSSGGDGSDGDGSSDGGSGGDGSGGGGDGSGGDGWWWW